MIPVVIVGGGIAGLAAAFELERRGVPFRLLEAAARAGGVIFSERADGYTIDAGPDALLVQKPDAIALCAELGIEGRLVATKPPRLAFIQRGGRLHPVPAASVLGFPTRVGPFLRSSLFSWRGKLRMGAELFVRRGPEGADESIAAFVTRRFGTEAATYLAEPLLAGIHAGDVDRLSVRALFPRLVEIERVHGSLLRGFRRQPPPPPGDEGAFRSLPGGLTELVTALVGALPPEAVRLGTPVSRVAAAAQGGAAPSFVVETGSGDRLEARAVILATPAYVTARLLQGMDAELSRLCDQVPYASTGTVALAFDRGAIRHPLRGSGFVVPRVEKSGILAGSWLSSKWPHRAPEGRVLLRAFVGGARDPHGLARSDRELVETSLAALTPLLGIGAPPLFTRVYRWERASVQHEVGHLARLESIERALAAHAGLFITGSGFRGVGIPDCIADGRAVAGRVAAALAQGTPR
jgi:oxygen-dependent protoporphyrinogen oxidase